MDWKQLTASLVDSLAWPAVVLVLILVFRTELPSLLSRLLARPKGSLRAGPVELNWEQYTIEEQARIASEMPSEQPASTQRERLSPLADDDPQRAILAAHARVEEALVERLKQEGEQEPERRAPTLSALSGLAAAKGILSAEQLRSIEGLTVLRNLAVHESSSRGLTPGKAKEFLDLADAVIWTLGKPGPDEEGGQ